MYTLEKLSEKLKLKFLGNGNLQVKVVCGLENLKENGVAFISDIASVSSAIGYKKRFLKESKYANKIVIVVDEKFKTNLPYNLIYSKDPMITHIQITKILNPMKLPKIKIDKSAFIGKNVKLGKSVRLGPNVVLYDNVKIGNNTTLFAGSIIMDNSSVGEDCIIYPNVVIRDDCYVGNNVILHPNCVIGSDGHGYFRRDNRNHKIPQVGKVYIEDDVEIGACSCIDRGRLENTIIRKGTKIDNLVQIAHNVEIGTNALISGQSGIGGSTKVGKNLVLGAQSGIRDNVKIGNNVMIAGKSGVISQTDDNAVLAGIPAIPINKWHRQIGLLSRVKSIFDRLRTVEKKLETFNDNKGDKL